MAGAQPTAALDNNNNIDENHHHHHHHHHHHDSTGPDPEVHKSPAVAAPDKHVKSPIHHLLKLGPDHEKNGQPGQPDKQHLKSPIINIFKHGAEHDKSGQPGQPGQPDKQHLKSPIINIFRHGSEHEQSGAPNNAHPDKPLDKPPAKSPIQNLFKFGSDHEKQQQQQQHTFLGKKLEHTISNLPPVRAYHNFVRDVELQAVGCPYLKGRTLYLSTLNYGELEVKVSHRMHSSSCYGSTMAVDILGDPEEQFRLPKKAFLKLWDFRFAAALRAGLDPAAAGADARPWSEDLSSAWFTAVQSGDLHRLYGALTEGDRIAAADDFQKTILQEIQTIQDVKTYYETEAAAYRRMRDLQGALVPKILSEVSLDIKPREVGADDADLFVVPGLLMEYIPGWTFAEMAHHVPREHWGALVQEAGRIIRLTSGRDFLNLAPTPENVMVAPLVKHEPVDRDKFAVVGRHGEEPGYRVVQVDFDETRQRGSESARDWAALKRMEDENAAFMASMDKLLREEHQFDMKAEREARAEGSRNK